jgi:anti-sigma B factor antagonist
MAVSIVTKRDDTTATLTVSGEVDVSNAAELREALEAQLADGVSAVVVDIAEVSYIDSTGIGVLVACAHEAQEAGATLAVRRPQRNVARVFALLDVAERLGVEDALD